MFNLSLKQKLLALCGFFCLILITVSTVSKIGIQRVETSFLRVVDNDLPSMNAINNMYLSYQKIRINLRSLGLANLSKTQSDNFIANVKAGIAEFEEHKEKYSKLEDTPERKALRSEMESQWKTFKGVGATTLGIYDSGHPVSPDAMAKLNQIFLVDCHKAAAGFDEAISNLKKFHSEKASSNSLSASDTGKNTTLLVLTVSVIGVFAGLLIGFIFSAKVANHLNTLSTELEKQSRNVVGVVQNLTNASQSLSAASTEQAAALQETASAVEEITSMVHRSSQSAKESAEASESSREKAEKGQQVINQMIASIKDINQSNDVIVSEVNQSNQRIADLVQVIQEIGNRTKVINDIVFQTKLLSFNASVEAARAGEHGKGFAVVAEEVGNLAQMSGNAAKEISTMLDESVKKVEAVVNETKKRIDQLMVGAKDTVSRGAEIAGECGEVFNDIYGNAVKVSNMVAGIAEASNEQARGVAEISRAIHELNQSTQTNAASANQCAGSADQLSHESGMLSQAAQDLGTIVNGNKAQQTGSVKPETAENRKQSSKSVTKAPSNVHSLKSPARKLSETVLPDPMDFDEVG